MDVERRFDANDPQFWIYCRTPFAIGEDDDNLPSVLNHPSGIAIFHRPINPFASHWFSSTDFPDDRKFSLQAESVYYLFHRLIFPQCCKHSPRRLHCNIEEEMIGYLLELPRERKEKIEEWFKREESRNEIISNQIQKKLVICPACSNSQPRIKENRWGPKVCDRCNMENIVLLEITHKPHYWINLAENLYLTLPITLNVRGIQKTCRFFMNLNSNKRTCACAYYALPYGFVYRGVNFIDAFASCSQHQRVPSLKSMSLCKLAIKLREKLDTSTIIQLRSELPLPRQLVEEMKEMQRTLTKFTDLFEDRS